MTFVAMGLVTHQEQTLVVAVCDALLSADTFTIHIPRGTKVLPLHGPQESGWIIGYSGDPTRFHPLRDILARSAPLDATGNAVVDLARLSYQAYRRELIEDSILNSYGLTLPEFLDSGLSRFGEKRFGTMCSRIDAFDVGLDILLAGFSPGALPSTARIAHVSNPGEVIHDFVYGVTAIGEGAAPALEYLYSVYDRGDPLSVALCRMLESKLIAEATTRSVGPRTSLLVLTPDNHVSVVSNEQCERFRKRWYQRRRGFPMSMQRLLKPSGLEWL